MPLYRLLYRSEASLQVSEQDWGRTIDQIVATSAQLNENVGLSGALVTSKGLFVQVLEGPLGPLEATFERICRDLRHRRVILMELAAAEERIFQDWSMVRIRDVESTADISSLLELDKSNRLYAPTTSALVSLMRNLLLSRRIPPTARGTGANFATPSKAFGSSD